VNAAGRARWGAFPAIIADDLFARQNFVASERVQVAAAFDWPVTEGFAGLVRVRRRQDEGSRELAAKFPDLPGLAEPTAPARGRLLRLALGDPAGFAVYVAVALAGRAGLFPTRAVWARGR
jgi:hypothetical protein